MNKFARSPEKGAETLVWLADSNDVNDQSGKYYTDKQITIPSVPAQNKDTVKRLWEVSKEQILKSETLR
jgi:hypothetical protein